jgi:hypothetical protein
MRNLRRQDSTKNAIWCGGCRHSAAQIAMLAGLAGHITGCSRLFGLTIAMAHDRERVLGSRPSDNDRCDTKQDGAERNRVDRCPAYRLSDADAHVSAVRGD